MEFRRDIQGLRAIAVLSVLLCHADILFDGGFIGVDVFFVISGFLITGQLYESAKRGELSLTAFYQRRALRILPPLIVMIAAALAAGYFFLLPIEYAPFSQSAAAALLSVSNIFFWQDAGYFTNEAQTKILLHTWSLGVEEQFYIVIPLLMALLARWRTSLLPLVIALICAASFALSVIQVSDNAATAFYLLPARLWELGLGSLLAIFGERLAASKRVREATSLAGFAVVVVAACVFSEDTLFPGPAALAPCIGAAAIIWAGQSGERLILHRFLSSPVMVFIGAISYSLYLWHWPIFAVARLEHALNGPWKIVWIASAFLLAAGSYYFVERPTRALRNKLSPRSTFAFAGAAITALVACCAIIWTMNGFEQRLSPIEANLEHFIQYDIKANYDFGGCFNGGEHDISAYNVDACLNRPSHVLLVGDSFGAHLLPGVRALYGTPRQATASGCLFLLHRYNKGRRTCAAILGRVLSPNFDTAGIDTIIIGGRYKADDVADIRPTVLEMRRRGLKVVLVGVMPTYRHARARELLMAMRRGEDPDASPYMERQWRLDDAIRTSIADIPGVTFVSPMRHFCSRTSCRQMLGRDPVTWDRSHITAAASINLLKAALEPNRMTVN